MKDCDMMGSKSKSSKKAYGHKTMTASTPSNFAKGGGTGTGNRVGGSTSSGLAVVEVRNRMPKAL